MNVNYMGCGVVAGKGAGEWREVCRKLATQT